MNLISHLFTAVSRPLFSPLLAEDPHLLALLEGGFLTLQDGGKIETNQ